MRLEWSYQRGRDSYMIRRELREAATGGCWTRGTLAELRQSQAAGTGGARSVAAHFGVGHLALVAAALADLRPRGGTAATGPSANN